MADFLKDLEYYSSSQHCYVIGEIINIDEEDNYIMKNNKDSSQEICESKNIRKIINISSTPLNGENEYICCEYIKNEDEYIEAEIKENKGLFYILEMEDEEGNQSTILARQKQIRYIEYIPIEDYIQEKYANVILPIKPELSPWVGSERFNDNLDRIYADKEKKENFKIFYSLFPSESPKSLRILCDKEEKDLARILLTTAMEKEKKLKTLNQDTENYKTQLDDAKKKNQTIFVNQKYIGLIIGKEGANIKNLKTKYGVSIEIPSKKADKKAKVIISGDDGKQVEECSKEINLSEKIFEIPESSMGDLKKRSSKLMEDYNIKYFSISNEEKKDEEGNTYKAPNVTIIGNSEYIDELYNNEIKDYENYNNYGNSYNNNYSGSSYRQNNRRYNNNYYSNNSFKQDNYKYNRGYTSYY